MTSVRAGHEQDVEALVETIRRALTYESLTRSDFTTSDARTALDSLAAVVTEQREALERIAEQQPRTLETLRRNGVVFDDLGNEPGNWQHAAFTIYTDLCEVDSLARAALAASAGGEDG